MSNRFARWRPWLAAAALAFAVLAAYQPAWRAGFIWDDDQYVTQNPLLTAPDGLFRIWFSRDSPSQYFPFTYTVFRVERALWGLHPAGYHWVNLLLHAANGILLWRLLRRLDAPGPWLGAAIFALHPVNVESVAWITELKNILSLLFYLLALRSWVEFLEEGRPRRAIFYVLTVLAGALALFSKTTACTLPAGLALIAWWKQGRIEARRWLQIAPFLVMGAAMGAVSVWWERFHQNTVGAAFHLGWMERCLIASRAVWFYLGKLLWPSPLVFIYPQWQIDPSDPTAWVWIAALALAAFALYLGRRSVGRGVIAAAVFYVAALSPLLGFVMEYTFRYTFVADHYQYIAAIAPCAVAGAGLCRFFTGWRQNGLAAFRAVRILVLLALGTLTWRQSRIYHDSETLWRANVAWNPDGAISHNNLATALLEKNDFQGALVESQTAVRLDPDDGNGHNNLGLIYLELGRTNEAIAEFSQAETLDPGNPGPPYNLGRAALALKDYPAAIAFFNKALRLQPDYAEAQCNLGFALLEAGRTAEAIAAYQKALAFNPDDALAHNDLGSIYLQQRRTSDALQQFQKAVDAMPDFAEAQCNLAEVLLVTGRRQEAIAHFQAALRAHPGYPPAVKRLHSLLGPGQ